jgi:genome maintenance exonuclease 1
MKYQYSDLHTVSENGLRMYVVDEHVKYPSITTILGNTISEEKQKSLNDWANSIGVQEAAQITSDAATKGTGVHLLIERHLNKEPLFKFDGEFTPQMIGLFNSLKFKLKNIKEVWGQEVALYSNLLRVAGRCDCIGVYQDEVRIIDFKTSRKLKSADVIEDYYLQLTAYSLMHNEQFGTNISKGVILMAADEGFPLEFKVDLEPYIDKLVDRVNLFYDTHRN